MLAHPEVERENAAGAEILRSYGYDIQHEPGASITLTGWPDVKIDYVREVGWEAWDTRNGDTWRNKYNDVVDLCEQVMAEAQ